MAQAADRSFSEPGKDQLKVSGGKHLATRKMRQATPLAK